LVDRGGRLGRVAGRHPDPHRLALPGQAVAPVDPERPVLAGDGKEVDVQVEALGLGDQRGRRGGRVVRHGAAHGRLLVVLVPVRSWTRPTDNVIRSASSNPTTRSWCTISWGSGR